MIDQLFSDLRAEYAADKQTVELLNRLELARKLRRMQTYTTPRRGCPLHDLINVLHYEGGNADIITAMYGHFGG